MADKQIIKVASLDELYITQLQQRLKAKEQECEKLKEKYKKYYQITLDDEIQINDLHKVIQEIKEIAEPFCNACEEFEPEKRGRDCMYCNYGKILQKISECEVGNEHRD